MDEALDFAFAPIGAGPYKFKNVVQTDLSSEVKEDARLVHLGEAEGLDIDDRRTLRLDLAPGHYVLYCNMEGHYLGRMHAPLEVR